jgi:DNA-binding NtrC family response regulator
MNTILIVDDQEGMRRSLEIVLQKEGYRVISAGDGDKALALLPEARPDVVITDLRMEPLSGIDVLHRIKELSPETEVIVMTAFGTIDSAVAAMKLGAFDYLTKPFKHEEIVLKVKRALEKRALLTEVRYLRGEVGSLYGVHSLVAESPAMKDIVAHVMQIASTMLTVLITGETGSGKSLLAKVIHYNSPRARGPFVAVNCASLPEPLLESELFGHEKGAFTGALQARKGLIEEAHQGTFFLDEIGTLSESLQSKLLGVFQDREVRRVGSNRLIPVDTRIIAATNRNLNLAVSRGEFRQDLFYRLNVTQIHLPPLRERREDIPVLVRHYLSQLSRREGKPYQLDDEAMHLLVHYDYSGNVRELENALERAAALASGCLITPKVLPESVRQGTALRLVSSVEEAAPARTLEEHERDLILQQIARHRGNLTQVARALGIGRTTLWRKMREYGVSR